MPPLTAPPDRTHDSDSTPGAINRWEWFPDTNAVEYPLFEQQDPVAVDVDEDQPPLPARTRAQSARRAGRRSSPLRIGAVLIAVALGGFMVLIMSMVIVLSQSPDQSQDGSFEPSQAAVADIPPSILPLYLQAGQQEGIDWAILAGIGKVETDHGRSTVPGVHSGVNSYGCCAGTMQFSVTGPGGGTWGAYGVDGNHDGQVSVYDPADAIPAAAAYLKASGAPDDYRQAIFAYNHATWYVAEVEQWADRYRGALQAGGTSALTTNIAGARDVLQLADGPHPRITFTASQRNDLSTGQIDPRLTSMLATIAQAHTITITALKSDHGLLTTSGSVSNHSAGRAADIGIVDGEVCNSIVHRRTGKCWQLAQQLAQVKGPLSVKLELIYGIDPDGPGPAFACTGDPACGGDHTDHVHVGYDA